MRPLLSPGTHVLRRGDGRLQLGIDPTNAVILTDSPAARLCLETVTGGAPAPEDASVRELIAELQARGMLVDEAAVMPLIGMTPGTSALPRPAGAALARTANGSAAAAYQARARTRIHLNSFGHPSGAELLDDLTTLLARAGLRTRRPRTDHVSGAVPLIGVLVGVGEPERELVDEWMRHALPFLLVRVTEGRTVVGPFVEPGRTACLRCIDAHYTDLDDAWPLLVQQYARAASRDRADGTPEPVDPTQVAAALALAAHDIAVYADGMQPNSWSATVTVGPDLVSLHTYPWQRHPECGCWWE